MSKIMIVDDELLARMGISSMLARYNAEFHIIAEADNAVDAFKIAKREIPDVIITDIKMPVMTGIDLIRRVKEEGLPCKFIILSAYSEFQYVREGLRLGAEDYFLKPELEEGKLVAMLRKLSAEASRGEEQGRNGYPSKQHKLVYRLMTGENCPAEEQIAQSFEQGGVRVPAENLSCMLCWTAPEDGFLQSPARTQQAFSMMESFLRNYGDVCGCIVELDIFCFLISFRQTAGQNAEPACQTLAAALPEYMKSAVNLSIFVAVDTPRCSYLSAVRFFQENCRQEKNHYRVMPRPGQGEENQYLFDNELSQIAALLDGKRVDAIPGAFEELKEKMRSSGEVSLKILHSACYSLVHMVDQFSRSNSYLNLDWNRSREFLFLIQNCRTKDDYLDYLDRLCARLSAWQYESGDSKLMMKAKEYIAQNYTKELSLSEVADHVGLNQNYFSRLFSQKAGCGFTVYVNSLRVERAKELLQSTDEKIQEIGEQVGFHSSFYFIKTFKKQIQMTPAEYRAFSRRRK